MVASRLPPTQFQPFSFGHILRTNMATLTRDQIEMLTPDQQTALASLEARHLRIRMELLEKARGYSGFYVVPTLLFLSAGAIGVFHSDNARLVPLCIIGLACLVQFHAAGLNRRLDALMELLDHDSKKTTESEQRDDDRTT
jgi:hypothetical protein